MDPANNFTTTVTSEWWFTTFNTLIIVFLALALLLAVVFLFIVAFNKTCQTVPVLLTAHSCFVELLYGSTTLSLAIFTFKNDRKQLVFVDPLCAFRGYLGYVSTGLFLYSFALQAIYRYVVVVHPMCPSWQSARVQSLLVIFTWIFAIVSLLPSLLMGAITYSVESQVCLVLFRLSFPVIYNMLMVYLIPVWLIILIYVKIARHVHHIGTCATPEYTLFQARRALTVVRRILTIIVILLVLGLPYTIFIFMSFFSKPPKYHLRIAIFLLDFAQTSIMIALFVFCQPVLDVLIKCVRLTYSRIQPTSK